MADFLPAYEAMIRNEGGYVLHDVPGDRGGQTYAGIARNMNPRWPGWALIDRGQDVPAQLVREFYKINFWDPIQGDRIISQVIAQTIFDFHVNAGAVARKLAQLVVGATPDGAIGDKTLAALNAYDEERFVMAYALAKIARYRDIVSRDRSQLKFLLGWINRTLQGVA
ncbi:MAG: N-acetylmuramidase [Caulobacteraceae bacterium]|nr:N-acetylmuramidase [Caulobacteraceae bacterium]